ncbi:uncharacterized protein LOC113279358 [Papaver somniferum]|uniref:uncharacterized protein LOC113279357 n=1 Tax=Papaver somniferum TaxID=3469 RepID=UPI000E701EE2|nr:uncharacterized protein LOC113279357 [Papaver somniferum]XP_026383837.1 uncharacterized protein LOC113279358 [Papaver somniferum]
MLLPGWYDNLKPGSIISWPAMVQHFLKKFYSAQRRVTAIDLGRCTQRVGEEIGKFITRFRDFTLECHEDIPEERLVEICIRGMDVIFRLNLTNFKFQTFIEVEEAASRISDCADAGASGHCWQLHSVNAASNDQGGDRGKGGIAVFGPYQGGQSSRRGGRTDGGRPKPPPLPCSREQIVGLLEQWVANKKQTLPHVVTEPTAADKMHERYCHYHRRVHHPITECFSLRYIVKMKRARGELEIGEQSIQKDPLPQHQVMMISHEPTKEETWRPWEDEKEWEAYETTEMATFSDTTGVASKFAQTVLAQQFFDSLGFSGDQIYEASKAIAAIASGKAYNPLSREVITFTDKDICYPGEHLRPLYLTAHINKQPLKRAFIDGGVSLNMISLHTLEPLGVPRTSIKTRATTVRRFGGQTQTTIGIVHLMMKIVPIRALTPFYVLEDDTTFHVLLGRGWILNHKVVASTYHQCVKTNIGGRQFRIPATNNLFGPEEAYMEDAVFYTQPGIDQGEQTERFITLPKWEEFQPEAEVNGKVKSVFSPSRMGPAARNKRAIAETKNIQFKRFSRPEGGHGHVYRL